MRKILFCAVLALLLGWSPFAGAVDLSRPVVLVAKPELRDALFGATVLVVNPIGDDQHAGFIINRPSDVTLDAALPANTSSTPLYVGGPVVPEIVIALVPQETRPGAGSIKLMDGLYAAYDELVIDALVAKRADSVRFVAGFVAWRPGELKREVESGAWYVMAPDASLVARNPQGLWEDLVRRLQAPYGSHASFTELVK